MSTRRAYTGDDVARFMDLARGGRDRHRPALRHPRADRPPAHPPRLVGHDQRGRVTVRAPAHRRPREGVTG